MKITDKLIISFACSCNTAGSLQDSVLHDISDPYHLIVVIQVLTKELKGKLSFAERF